MQISAKGSWFWLIIILINLLILFKANRQLPKHPKEVFGLENKRLLLNNLIYFSKYSERIN